MSANHTRSRHSNVPQQALGSGAIVKASTAPDDGRHGSDCEAGSGGAASGSDEESSSGTRLPPLPTRLTTAHAPAVRCFVDSENHLYAGLQNGDVFINVFDESGGEADAGANAYSVLEKAHRGKVLALEKTDLCSLVTASPSGDLRRHCRGSNFFPGKMGRNVDSGHGSNGRQPAAGIREVCMQRRLRDGPELAYRVH